MFALLMKGRHPMNKVCINRRIKFSALATTFLLSLPYNIAVADDSQLKEEVKILKQKINLLNKKVDSLSVAGNNNHKNDQKHADNQASQNSFSEIRNSDTISSQWTQAASLSHLSGYADAGYVDRRGENARIFLGHFNPVFHFLYRDLILAEGELELEVNSEGKTEVALEYADLGLFLNNYMMLIVGKFQSPLGHFQQNLHPSWINKLPSPPPGFAHDQAAPASEMGVELRGGLPIKNSSRMTYAVYVSNGPKAEVEDDEIEEIEGEGLNSDTDGSKVVGGRIGFQPIPNFEIGLSGAIGKIGLFGSSLIDKRDYSVLGADAVLFLKNLQLRGEIIQQKISSKAGSDIAGGKWRGWYGQASYLFKPTKLEAIIRYGEYASPHATNNFDQCAFGLDYWFAPSVVVKAAYEINRAKSKPENGSSTIGNAFFLQLAYGF